MPGNFDSMQKISAGKVNPTGPLSMVAGETDTELYIGVVQQPNASMRCKAMPSADGKTWAKVPWVGEEQHGEFRPGAAMGWGEQTATVDGESFVFFWLEGLTLTT
jgi:hypothetical protein